MRIKNECNFFTPPTTQYGENDLTIWTQKISKEALFNGQKGLLIFLSKIFCLIGTAGHKILQKKAGYKNIAIKVGTKVKRFIDPTFRGITNQL